MKNTINNNPNVSLLVAAHMHHQCGGNLRGNKRRISVLVSPILVCD